MSVRAAAAALVLVAAAGCAQASSVDPEAGSRTSTAPLALAAPPGQKTAMVLTATTYSMLDGCADHVRLIHHTLTGVAFTDQGVKGSCPSDVAASQVGAVYETVLKARPRFLFNGHGITLGSGKTVLTFE